MADGKLGDLLVTIRASSDKFESDISKIQTSGKNFVRSFEDVGKRSAATLKLIDKGGEQLGHSLNAAQGSAKALTDMIGIQLPKAANRMIAESSLIGPVLASAFGGVAVLGMIQALGQLPALFDKLSEAVTGWDKASKKAYADFITANKAAVQAAQDLLIAQNELLHRADPIAALTGNLEIYQKALDEARKNEERLFQAKEKLLAAQGPAGNPAVQISALFNDQGLAETVAKWKDAGNEAARLAAIVTKLQKDDLPKATAAAADKEIEGLLAIDKEIKAIAKERTDNAKHYIAIWGDALADFKNRTLAGGDAVLAGLNAAKQIAADIIAIDKERMKLAEEAGDALIKSMQFWDTELQRIRNQAVTGGGAEELIKDGEDAGRAAGKAIIDAFNKTKKAGQDFIDHFTSDISQMFTGMIAHGQSFWDAFKNLGRSAVAAIADSFLSKMIHNFLDPFAADLGKTLNQVFSSAAKGAKNAQGTGEDGDKQFSLSALVKGGLIAAATTAAIAGLAKVGSAIVGMFGKLRKLANEFVQKTQDSMTASVTALFDNLTDAQRQGNLTADQVKEARFQFEKMWTDFQRSAAAAGIVGQQGLATMEPFIESWRTWLDGLEAAGAALEHLARVEAFREQVLGSTKGADDLAEAILSLQAEGVTTAQIIAFLGDDIRRFADNLRTMGLDIPPSIQAMIDAMDQMEGRGTKLRHAIATWMLPETGLVSEAARREALRFPINVPATAGDTMPIRSSAAPALTMHNAVEINLNVTGDELTVGAIRDKVMPAIDDMIETGLRGYREKWTRIFSQSAGVVSSASVPA